MENTGVKLNHQDWEPYIIHCRNVDGVNTKVNNSKKINWWY